MLSTSVHPVFVYGALRSGTTLLRLMLNEHQMLQSPGEADYLFDHLRHSPSSSEGWSYDRQALVSDRIFRATGIVLDPEKDGLELLTALLDDLAALAPGRVVLTIHRAATVMGALFPKAPVIHLLRDPRDVARSSVGMGWAGTSYHGATHWITTEQDWEVAGIDPSRVVTLHFEDLMAAPESELTRVCAFLGLPFDQNMLGYHKVSTYDPLDARIAAKWKGKATPREIALIEGRVKSLLQARGYAPAGEPGVPSLVEAVNLAFQNHTRRWGFNIRRYGFFLFAAHHAARLLRLHRLRRRLAAQQEEIRIRNLK